MSEEAVLHQKDQGRITCNLSLIEEGNRYYADDDWFVEKIGNTLVLQDETKLPHRRFPRTRRIKINSPRR